MNENKSLKVLYRLNYFDLTIKKINKKKKKKNIWKKYEKKIKKVKHFFSNNCYLLLKLRRS